jgi:hypothetical protein
MTDDTDTLTTDDLRRPYVANDQGDQTAQFLSTEYETPQEAHSAGVDPAYAAGVFRTAGMDDLAGQYHAYATSVAQPAPQAPTSAPIPTWDSIASHPDFQALPSAEKQQVVDKYATHARDFALSLPEAPDSTALDDHFSQWSQVTKDRLVNPLTPEQATAIQTDVGAGPGRALEAPEGSPQAQDALLATPAHGEAAPVKESVTVQDAYHEAGGGLGGVINAFDFVSKQPIITHDQAKQFVDLAATPAQILATATGNTEAERGVEERLSEELSSWTSPEGLGQLVLLKNPVARALFAGNSFAQVPGDIASIKSAIDKGDQKELGKVVAGAGLNLIMGAAMAAEPIGGKLGDVLRVDKSHPATNFLQDLKTVQETAPTMPETAKALTDKAHIDFQAAVSSAKEQAPEEQALVEKTNEGLTAAQQAHADELAAFHEQPEVQAAGEAEAKEAQALVEKTNAGIANAEEVSPTVEAPAAPVAQAEEKQSFEGQQLVEKPGEIEAAVNSGGTTIPRYVELSDGSQHQVAPFQPVTPDGEIALANGNTVDRQVVTKVLDENKNPIGVEQPTKEARDIFGFGPGAAAKGEIPEAKAVSIRNAKVDEERATRGELPLMAPARKAMGKTWDEGMQRVEKNPSEGDQMVTQILNGDKKAVSEVDHAVLLHEKIRVLNERSMEADRSTDPNASEEDRADARVKWAAAEDQLNNIDHATQQAGTISGRALQFRNAVALDDYTFANMERRARAAKGRPLTQEESAAIKEKADKIAEAAKVAADVEAKSHDQQVGAAADAAIQTMRGDRASGEVDRNKVLEQMRARIADGDSPENLGSYIQRIALAFVRDGVTTREPLVSAVHDFTKDVTDFDSRQTRDAISGYGDFKPLDKETAKVQLRGIKGELQQIAKLEDMAAGQAPLKTGLERREPTDAERALIKQVNEAKKAGGFDVTDPETQLRSALESVKTRLKNQISDLQTQIDTGERTVKTRSAPPTDAEADALRAKRDELKKQFNDIFGSDISDQQRLAASKSYLTRRATELEDRITQNDFSNPPQRAPITPDRELLALRAKVERLKGDFKSGLYKELQSKRSFGEKAADWFVGWRRFNVISGISTLGKIATAGQTRIGMTAADTAAGAVLSRFPGIREIAKGAPREGSSAVSVLAKGYVEGWKDTISQAGKVLKTGKTDVEMVNSPLTLGRTMLDYMGNLHALGKLPAFAQEYHIGLLARTEYAMRNGVDVTDPVVQLRLSNEATQDGLRAKFSHDNFVTKRLSMVLASLRNAKEHPTTAKAIEKVIRFMLPVVHIPTNWFAESATYSNFGLGLPRAMVKTYQGLRDGVDTLSEAQKDSIMRHWKKGSLGAGLMLLGYYTRNNVGGYYREQSKEEKANQPKFGGIRIAGHDVPRWLIHFPIMEPVHFGATIGHVMDHVTKKTGEQGTAFEGAVTAATGLLDEIPYVQNARNVTELLAPGGQGKHARGSIAKSALVPRMISEIAEWADRDSSGETVKRQPHTLPEHIESGLPGLRQGVPEKKATASQKPAPIFGGKSRKSIY